MHELELVDYLHVDETLSKFTFQTPSLPLSFAAWPGARRNVTRRAGSF